MRQYRGISIDTCEWVYGSLQWLENKYRNFPSIEAKILQPTEYNHMANFNPHRDKRKDFKRDWIIYDVIPETVGEQIGTPDCDGREIYRGDILGDGTTMAEPCTVVYNQVNARYVAQGTMHRILGHNFGLYRVVGTIHDNTEAL